MRSRQRLDGSEIAVIGMAGRFPGARDVPALWRNLVAGVESVARIDLDRWSEVVRAHRVFLERPEMVPARPIIDGIDLFDAAFFGYTPREAQILDPQQRLFLECAWHSLEDAGYDSEQYPGRIGVIAGVSQSSYLLHFLQWDRELSQVAGPLQIGLGNMNDALATRVAYKLNLRGPAYAVQSFCSTSLVAIHLACQTLLNHESDMCLAGGVTITASQDTGYTYQEGGILSPDGHTRTFDARARGMVFGNGLGIVVLKRLADALADGDNVRAVLLGSAVNNDGSVKVGYTAPSVVGQAEVIAETLSSAGVDPATIGYVEAHGTATALGDPAEVAGLTRAWRKWTDARQFCALGSVKTNIGHLDAAAGVAGVIKSVLCLENRQIPASLNYETPNPEIDFEGSPFYVNAALRDWEPGAAPRRAAVSSFGIGGTNAHAILQEAPERAPSEPALPHQLLLLSARSDTALRQAVVDLAEHLESHPGANLADVAFTLQVGRRAFDHRLAVVARDPADAVSALRAGEARVAQTSRRAASVAFLFSGQGAQYAGMGRGLYETEPVFREAIDRCAGLLAAPLQRDLRELLFPAAEDADRAEEELRQTRHTQPALFAVEYAMARLWISWGVTPAAMIGHSVGEYVAAQLAGVFSLEDALRLVAERGRLMQSMPPGAMLAVTLSEAALRPQLDPALDVAAVNGPAACVVAGAVEAVEELEGRLAEAGIGTRRLRTSHAFHSSMMEPVLGEFRRLAEGVERRAPQLPFVSNVSGDWIGADEAVDPDYWARHLRKAVRFADGVRRLRERGDPLLLEVGPGSTLATLARLAAPPDAPPAVASLRHPREQRDDRAVFLEALGQLWMAGAKPDWQGGGGSGRRRVSLPAYPFEGRRYWVDVDDQETEAREIARGVSLKRQALENWFYQPSWHRFLPAAVAAEPPPGAEAWLLFLDDAGLGEAMARRLESSGRAVVRVRAGARFRSVDGGFEVDPARRESWAELVAALGARGALPSRITHLWGVGRDELETGNVEGRLALSQERGFYSLLFFAQALARAGVEEALRLCVVTSHMQEVVGGDLTRPEKATATGPCKVIPAEMPTLSVRAVDVVLSGPAASELEWLAARLICEQLADQQDLVVAYRGAHRWIQTAERTPLRSKQGVPLRDAGSYLITGGLGGIGLALAEHLARTRRARLVLTGRSELPPRASWERHLAEAAPGDASRSRVESLVALEKLGAEVLYLAADVASAEDMERVVGAAVERFGSVTGVVHAAGVAGGGIVALKEPEVAARVMAPKVEGTLALLRALRGQRPDFVLLCSSTAAVLGGFGQVDYCAANCFMDAMAQARPAGPRLISVNWDAWREVGMAVNTPVSGALQAIRELSLRIGIAPAEGVEAFERILASGLPQLVAITMDLRPALLRRFLPSPAAAGSREPRERPGADGGVEPSPAPQPAAPELVGISGSLERTIAETWVRVLGRQSIAADENFFELGGDSLTALQAIALLKARLDRDVPVATFYDAPTVTLLARALSEPEAGERPVALDEVERRAETRLELLKRRRRQRAATGPEEGR